MKETRAENIAKNIFCSLFKKMKITVKKVLTFIFFSLCYWSVAPMLLLFMWIILGFIGSVFNFLNIGFKEYFTESSSGILFGFLIATIYNKIAKNNKLLHFFAILCACILWIIIYYETTMHENSFGIFSLFFETQCIASLTFGITVVVVILVKKYLLKVEK